jgi:hypothetical protein
MEPDFIDENEDRTLDRIIEALESVPIPPPPARPGSHR